MRGLLPYPQIIYVVPVNLLSAAKCINSRTGIIRGIRSRMPCKGTYNQSIRLSENEETPRSQLTHQDKTRSTDSSQYDRLDLGRFLQVKGRTASSPTHPLEKKFSKAAASASTDKKPTKLLALLGTLKSLSDKICAKANPDVRCLCFLFLVVMRARCLGVNLFAH